MTKDLKYNTLLLVAKYFPPNNQRLNLALITKALWQTIGPTLIRDNVRAFLWEDPSTQPSVLLHSLRNDDPELMKRILDSVDFEKNCSGGVLSQREGEEAGTGGVEDDFVDYALTLCFYNKSYRCLRVLITGLPAVRLALDEDPVRWRSYLDDDGEICKYLSGFISE